MPRRCAGGGVGLADDRHVALRRADHGDVELVVVDRLELDGLLRDALAGERRRVALHLEVHADLEQLQRRAAGGSTPRRSAPASTSSVPVQAEPRVGLDGEREPHVEVVVAQVVVRDAGVGVDDLRGAPGVLGVDLGGDQHRGVAQRARVVDRRDLADDPLRRAAAARARSDLLARRSARAARDGVVGPGLRAGSCPASG